MFTEPKANHIYFSIITQVLSNSVVNYVNK